MMARRSTVSLAFLLVVAAAAAGLAPLARQDDKKPDDEKTLWSQAEEKFSKGIYNDAAKQYDDYLEKFPKGAHAESAAYKRGQARFYARNYKTARENFEAFLEKHPKSEQAAHAQLMIAQSWAYERNKEEGVKAYKKLFKDHPNTQATQEGLWQYWNLVEKTFQFSVYQSFTEGEEVSVNWYFRNIDKVNYRLWQLDEKSVAAKVEKATKIASVQDLLATMPKESWKEVRKWSETPDIAKRKWQSGATKVEIPSAGFYIFEAEHDEVAIHVNLIVARYGIITKTSKGKTVIYAVDRRNSKPVAGMKIRIFEGKVTESATGEDGLLVLDRESNGTIVGIRDGEIALSNVTTWVPGKELKAYVFTDRPVYRPNQTVCYKGTLADNDGGKLTVLANQKITFHIRDPRGNSIRQESLTTNEFGGFSGEMLLGDEPPLGFYYMTVQLADGRQSYAQFRVEEYRKPEYKVNVQYPNAPHLQGETVTAQIAANYYFGSPVVEADVKWTVFRRPYYQPYWRWRWDPYDWDLDDDDDDYSYGGKGRRYYYGYGEQIATGTGRTDKEGRLAINFKSDPMPHDVQYTVVAKVTDRSRREVEGVGTCKATRALIEMSVSANRYVYTPGDKVTVKLRATDTDGKVVKDLTVKLRAATSRWIYHKESKKGEYQHEEFFSGSTKTDENGLAEISFTVEKEGYLHLLATAKDRKENEVRAESWIWCSGRAWTGDFMNFNGLEIIPDKSSYTVGETAKVLISSQHKNVHVLVTLECDRIYKHMIVHVKGHTAMVEIPIDTASYSPNVYLSAAALVKNEFLHRTKVISVPPKEKLVDVKIMMDQSKYRPRDGAELTIVATDSEGRPVKGEFSIGMVDESIYAIQDELAKDARKFFYSKKYNRVQTNSSIHYVDHGRAEGLEKSDSGYAGGERGRRMGAKEEPKAESKDKKGGAMAETETRAYFPDTMFWRAHVVTDGSGRATFKLAMPDSLTTWRVTARGVTTDAKVGQQTHTVICRKEVIVRLETPRFFTQNDQTVISAVVHNYRNDVDEVRVTLEAEGVELIGAREVTIKVATGEDKRVDWRVNVKKAGSAKFTAKAESPKESDAMQLVIPILPHGALQIETKAGMIETSQKFTLTVPQEAIREASELKIVVSPSVASQVLDALEYLAGYPYGCVEQTMSRFLPSVVTATTLQKLGLENEKLKKELPQMVAQGLQRLYNFQHQDGGWGWWEADASHPYMTAYVVYGLSQAKEADFQVDANVLERGIQCLDGMLKAGQTGGNRKMTEHPIDAKMYMAYVLTMAGRPVDLKDLLEHRNDLNNYSRGLLASALWKAGKAEDARTVLANLDETAKVGESYCYWEGNATRYSWMDNNLETTAYILKAMLAIDPKNDKVHKVVRWLSTKRQGNRWFSTKDTAAIVFALTDYIAATKELEADYTLVVKLNGDPIVRERITKENLLKFDGVRVLKANQFNFGANEITIEKEGKGNLYYALMLKYYSQVEDFKPSKGSIRIERTYARVTWDGKVKVSEALKDGDTVKSGEEIEVTLKVECDGNYEYVMIEDPLPAGFEVVKEDRFYGGWGWRRGWNWWYSRVEARDERVCIAATYLRGGQAVSYMIRAETPGDFHVLPTFAYNMYAVEIAGTSGENRIKVSD